MKRVDFIIFCLMFFAVSFGVAAMAALVPSIAAHFGVAGNYALKLTWLYMLPYGVVALLWSPLTRVIKLKKLFLFAALGFFLSALLFCTAPDIKAAFIFRFLMGCFGCSFVPLTLITIGKTLPADKKAQCVGILFGLSYFSTLISVFLSGFLSWRIIYLIPAVLSLVVLILIFRHLNDFDFRKERFRISYLDTLKDKQAVSFFIAIMLASFLYHSLQQRLGVYLHLKYSLDQMAISTVFTALVLSATLFEFWGGFLSSRFGNIRVAKAGFFLMSLFILFLIFTRRYQLICLAVAFWGAGWALTHVGLSSHLASFSDRILRDASSLNSALRFSFGGLGGFMGGALVGAAGFNTLFIVVGAGVLTLGFVLNKIIH